MSTFEVPSVELRTPETMGDETGGLPTLARLIPETGEHVPRPQGGQACVTIEEDQWGLQPERKSGWKVGLGDVSERPGQAETSDPVKNPGLDPGQDREPAAQGWLSPPNRRRPLPPPRAGPASPHALSAQSHRCPQPHTLPHANRPRRLFSLAAPPRRSTVTPALGRDGTSATSG